MKPLAAMLHAVASYGRLALGKLTLLMPIFLMALLALATWWLARQTPLLERANTPALIRTEPDYTLANFSIKTFDANGALVTQLWGRRARHYPQTDILEIDEARFRSNKSLRVTSGRADRAYSNADGSQVQLVGNAVLTRASARDASGRELPALQVQSEFLHAFLDTEIVKSHKSVTLTRGEDQFKAEAMVYDNIEGLLELNGKVRVQWAPRLPRERR